MRPAPSRSDAGRNSNHDQKRPNITTISDSYNISIAVFQKPCYTHFWIDIAPIPSPGECLTCAPSTHCFRAHRVAVRREARARRRDAERTPAAREASALGRDADRAPRLGRRGGRKSRSENFPARSLLKTIKTELESIRWAGGRKDAASAPRPSPNRPRQRAPDRSREATKQWRVRPRVAPGLLRFARRGGLVKSAYSCFRARNPSNEANASLVIVARPLA